MENILAADIGGTNTRFTLYQIDKDNTEVKKGLNPGACAPGAKLFEKKYLNQDYPSFVAVLQKFLEDAKASSSPPVTACFAVAGPVFENKVVFTNRSSWSIEGGAIEKQFGIRKVRLINDFLAVGYGLLTLDEQAECICLQRGKRDPNGPIACIGAGTGLGECYLTPDSNGSYLCFPSEGGHADFAPRGEVEEGLLHFLKEKFKQPNRVSVERVVSGSGLVNIYEYLAKTRPEEVDAGIQRKIDAEGDLAGAVIASNLQNSLCNEAMRIFVSAYGSEAGVAALKWLPFGGLYLTGGLTPKNIKLISDPKGPFLVSMRDKGRLSSAVDDIPVYAVMVENLGERGAHRTAFSDYEEVHASIGLRHSDSLRHHQISETTGSGATPISTPSMNPFILVALGISALVLGFAIGQQRRSI